MEQCFANFYEDPAILAGSPGEGKGKTSEGLGQAAEKGHKIVTKRKSALVPVAVND
jgi:hypothetical protein